MAFDASGYREELLVADSMDVDLDVEGQYWANELNHLLANIGPEPNLDVHGGHHGTLPDIPNFESRAGYPIDMLFIEDEPTLPVFFDAGQVQHPSHDPVVMSGLMVAPTTEGRQGYYPGPNFHHDGGSQQLRHQLALLAGGSCGDELVFKDCDPSKAIAVHNLALELGLNYSHDAKSSLVSVSRNPVQPSSTGHPAQPPILPPVGSELLWVSEEHALPAAADASFPSVVVEMEDVDSLYDKFIQEPLSTKGLPPIPRYELTESYLPDAGPAQPPKAGIEVGKVVAKKGKEKESLDRQPSRSERIGRSISKHVSGWKTTIAKGGRKGPLTLDGRRDMKALEGAGGACWRCKVLRRKCNPGATCRCCLQSVATPSVGEDAPLWPIIGCRRGKLRDSIVEQVLCPKARGQGKSHESDRCGSFRSRRSVDSISDGCLLAAESQRLSDMKDVLEGASYKISITNSDMRRDFVSFVEEGRYRNQECLSARTFSFQETSVNYSDLIATIAWELAENQTVLPLLEIKSWRALMSMLETACIYEAEVGQTSLVMISMICLRQCLQALRLSSANLLSASAHDDCTHGHCQVHYIRELLLGVRSYIDELSTVIFNKENMRDRRWWLSTFYSLYIQSYVRHALIAVEKQLCFPDLDDVPAEDLTSTQYLHLAGVLFTAASAKYDPLLGGQYQYTLTDNSVIPETSIPELHHSSVRAACEVDTWGDAGIKSSYQFLRRLLQIGSLDFDELGGQHDDDDDDDDVQMMEEPEAPRELSEDEPQVAIMGHSSTPSLYSPAMSYLESPRDIMSTYSYHAPSFYSHRASFDSRYSVPSLTSMSNFSDESLAKTFVTDMTSIYEVPMEATAGASTSSTAVTVPAANKKETPTTITTTREVVPLGSFLGHGTSPLFKSGGNHHPPIIVCSCCPKAPRSFHSAAELAQHESEKPHPCSHPPCKARFKSPKEAERHINAIHLKSDYWSCEALCGADINSPLRAFHCETFSGSTYDVCGFCGGGFERKKQPGSEADEEGGAVNSEPNGKEGGGGAIANVLELVHHLDSIHKRGECNRERRFYRVDNFRQHLKTAHLAKPGKWLKILERNCKAGGGDGGGGSGSGDCPT